MPNYIFDERTKRYRDTRTGRFLSEVTVNKVLKIALSAKSATELTRMYKDGTISKDIWHRGFRKLIKETYINSAILAKGGREQMTDQDWGKTGGHVAEQYWHLDRKEGNFLDSIDDLTLKQAQARAEMYIRSGKQVFEEINRDNKKELGAVFEWWHLGGEENCESCLELTSRGMVPIGTLGTVPGAGETICLTNCQCHITYHDAKGKKLSAKSVLRYLLQENIPFNIVFGEEPIFLLSHSRTKCMLCPNPPEVDIRWAEGIGRAWFCKKCFEEWKKEHPGEVNVEHKVKGGEVPPKWGLVEVYQDYASLLGKDSLTTVEKQQAYLNAVLEGHTFEEDGIFFLTKLTEHMVDVSRGVRSTFLSLLSEGAHFRTDGERFVVLGSAKSGFRGHKGRKGKRGGSVSRSSLSIVRGGEFSNDQIETLRDEISSQWEGERKTYAMGGFGSFYSESNEVILVKQGDELVGIGTLGRIEKDPSVVIPPGVYSWVRTAATKRSGYGRELMQALVDRAKIRKTGIALIADPQAAGFYRKLGMREVGSRWDNMFYWEVNEL